MAAVDDTVGMAPVSSGVPTRSPGRYDVSSLLLLAASAMFLAPVVQALLAGSWTTEAGALGPLVLVSGTLTLWHCLRAARALSSPGLLWLALLGLTIAGTGYLAGRAINMAALLCASAWLALVAVLYGCHGPRVVRQCWFPLLFLLIVIPLPYALTAEATAFLRTHLAGSATRIAALFGLEVAVNGYAVFVDQYELSIESACAGLNSTVSLIAVGALYACWVRRAGWHRMVLIAGLALPVAVAANLGRIVALLALVHWGGSRALATPLHPLSGFLSFTFALAMLLLADRLASLLDRRGPA